MKTSPIITKRAAQVIKQLMNVLPEGARETYIPVVTWISSSNESDFVPGPYVGGIERNKVQSKYVVNADGIDVVYNIDELILSRYRDCVLDHVDGKFIFIDQKIAKFLKSE